MLKRIHFCGRWEASDFALAVPWAVISITDPGSKLAKLREENRQAVLRLSFHDLDQPLDGFDKLFTPAMARQVIQFVTKWAPKIEVLLCQCEAGISRSAATAAFVAKAVLGQDDAEYFRKGIPNKLVYRTLLKEWERRMLREGVTEVHHVEN